jgi:hypothetical protein
MSEEVIFLMPRWIPIFGGLLIMMGHHTRSEALFYYLDANAGAGYQISP